MTTQRHPIFARAWTALSHAAEGELRPLRAELVAGLHGRVLEVGAGNGLNFVHYPPTVREVVAVEPEPFLRLRAQAAARDAPVPVNVMDARAEQLPLEDGSIDAAVCCLVLCSVTDQRQALSELRRVLRPGGELRILEHVRSGDPRAARRQQRLDSSGIWPLLGGGCHCSRTTVDTVRAAGFSIENRREESFPPGWSPVNPIVLATAFTPS
jgi:ubiquinone/menaquinone biosynthesis C-methylase UbiE